MEKGKADARRMTDAPAPPPRPGPVLLAPLIAGAKLNRQRHDCRDGEQQPGGVKLLTHEISLDSDGHIGP
jgi:hypothetical protein